MPIEGKFGVWKSDTISSGTSTAEIDLGNTFEKLLVLIPTITSATTTVHVSNASGGTFYPMHALDDDATGSFVHATSAATTTLGVVFNLGGAQYIKVVFGATQTAVTVTVRGIK